MWMNIAVILFGIVVLETFLLIWNTRKYRQEVRTLSWRVNSIWSKVSHWHHKVDHVTGEVRRWTGEQKSIEIEGAEEFDDTDRDADTQVKVTPKKNRSRKRSK